MWEAEEFRIGDLVRRVRCEYDGIGVTNNIYRRMTVGDTDTVMAVEGSGFTKTLTLVHYGANHSASNFELMSRVVDGGGLGNTAISKLVS